MNTNLKAELIAVFTKQIDARVRSAYEQLVAKHGQSMSGVANTSQYRVWSETVRPCCERTGDRMNAKYVLSEVNLSNFAAALSESLADEVLVKVNAKIGDLLFPQIRRVGGANFVISGTKKGHKVTIEQNQIINVSVKGKLFNQYPSRIYVDNKFTPAAKFALI